ncbi:MAG: Peptidoglycan glycosyltransferase [Candidatus Woesebacteria bacterium GW2011_GWB1_39_12]|uniref:Peptidoglycan glycosyltransferase n=2 Tax=Candidatus Woeseibacteriota TaxID=1752722 RepID=A0A0G0Q6P8_9BACT|nr:MAG: Peptidoglycan glycosyltransferase [Candidatus Woesebacteria bacterium GW2011_GWA1_39_12]KKR00402.1 MAG: Peptidoglycan glycosyltransferase [Candidatus Woesebacteria bacterium GW2011_GWB1_39_12]
MVIRLKIIFFLFLIAFLTLLGKLFYWQILKGKELSIQARSQHQSQSLFEATRGDILATDGSWLAASSEAYLVFANPSDIKLEPKKLSEKLAPFFIENPDDKKEILIEIDRLTLLLAKEDLIWVPLKHKVERDIKEKIESLGLEGIGFEKEEKRVYPEASTAAHLLGFVGKDKEGSDVGYFGLEGFYDVTLSGRPGYSLQEKDAGGLPILIETARESSAIKGVSLLTHIDKFIQITLDRELQNGLDKYQAESGIGIVVNPENGAILAISSYPSYDPAKYWDFGNEFFTNPAISQTFEPGSIFKVLVMASALDAGVVKPETQCDKCSGPVNIDKYVIETWNQVYYPNTSMVDVIVHSDNVGMVYVAQKLGSDKLYDYLSGFGIGEGTGIDLQGEANPGLRDKGKWGLIDLATSAFGQGVAVTPIQMITAVSVIANKGLKVSPQVVDKIRQDAWEEDIKPVIGKRVISEKAAGEITGMMVEAAKNGEAKWTYKRGFKVAGKTGTAQIPIEGHYDEEKTIASYVGFAPYDDPKFVMLISLREPKSSPWASETAAPLWYEIASDLFVYFGIQPEN